MKPSIAVGFAPRLMVQPPPGLCEPAETARGRLHRPSFMSAEPYPKARIQHGKAGDDILMRYYKQHGTFSGATVYIKPNVNNLRL